MLTADAYVDPLEFEADWDKGLPMDVLSLVAKAGGLDAMKSMRGVSKTWQQGFELGITHIRIPLYLDPTLPPGARQTAQRFLGATSLDARLCAAHESWLQTLKTSFPGLQNLILGASRGNHPQYCLARRLTDAGLTALSSLQAWT